VVKYRKIPPVAAANQIAENARIPPAADLQKNKIYYEGMLNHKATCKNVRIGYR
jgi:hypothetical protein